MQGGRQQGRRSTVALNSVHCNPQNPSQFVVGGNGACLRVYDQRMAPAGNSELTQPVRGRPAACMAASCRASFELGH